MQSERQINVNRTHGVYWEVAMDENRRRRGAAAGSVTRRMCGQDYLT